MTDSQSISGPSHTLSYEYHILIRVNARGFGPFPVRPQEVSALSRFGPGGFGPNIKFSVFFFINMYKI